MFSHFLVWVITESDQRASESEEGKEVCIRQCVFRSSFTVCYLVSSVGGATDCHVGG